MKRFIKKKTRVDKTNYNISKIKCFQKIKCPECGKIIDGVSEWEKGMPFWSYVCECPHCKYIITESEWQVVKNETKITYFTKKEVKMKRFKCRVCGEKFDDLLVHLYNGYEKTLKREYHKFKHPSVFLDINDVKSDHLKKFKRIRESIGTKENMRCFCGGYIYTESWTNDYGSFIEILCDKCGFLWDEYFQG